MADDEDKKAKIVNLFKEGSKPARKRAPRIKAVAAAPDFYVSARGDTMIAGGDINTAGRDININKKEYPRTTVQAPPGSLTPAQAKRIQDAIAKLVEIDVVGGGDRSKRFKAWHAQLRNHFSVPSYLFIRADRADEALAWLKTRAAMNRPKLRRTDNQGWRNAHYTAIYARAAELGMSKADLYALVFARLEKRVISLKRLGEQDLNRFYGIMMAKRP